MNREMMNALEEDGEKLRQLTGEDHGPWSVPEEWVVCEACDGEGEVGTGRMSHSVNSATIDPPWEIMTRCPECNGAGGSLYEREADAISSPQGTKT
jgi:DnaJ-class molecular chaperone